MSVHWGLEAHTTTDTTETHLLELVPLMHFMRQIAAQPVMPGSRSVPPLSSSTRRSEDLRLTAASSAVAHALSAICLGHWANECQNRTWHLLEIHDCAMLPDTTPPPRKTWTKPLTVSSLQTGYTSVIKSTSVSTSKIITDRTCNLCDN